jgi:hypothetical protein
VTPPDLPEFTRISLIDDSPHDPGTAYLAGNRYQRSDRAPYVYKTADFGQTWKKIVTGIPGNDFPRAIREDPKRKGLLFLGTETGIFVSFDDGGVWQPLQLDSLPVTPVHGIQIKNDDLVIGTHGRSFYILDNIGVLRQAARETTNEEVVLFDPSDAVRSVSRGVFVDYFLKKPADKVTIEVLDSKGQAVNSFGAAPPTTAPAGAATPPPDEGEGGFRPPPPARATGRQGMNRFTWDMRYPGATEFPGMILWAGGTRGPAAPPGRYSVKLTANGITKTQEFEIRRNAAGAATDADLQEQFTLAKQINDKVSAANQAVVRIRALKDQIADRTGKASNARVKTAGQALTDKLTGIEGEIYQYRNRSSQDPLNYPIRLNNKLAALQGLVESGDYKPTDQSYAIFKDLSSRLDKELARLDAAVKGDVPALNKQLAAAKLDPIK